MERLPRKEVVSPTPILMQWPCMRWLQENHKKNKQAKSSSEDDQWLCIYSKEIYRQGPKRISLVSCRNLECNKHMQYCCIPKSLSDTYPKPFIRTLDTDFYSVSCFTSHNPQI